MQSTIPPLQKQILVKDTAENVIPPPKSQPRPPAGIVASTTPSLESPPPGNLGRDIILFKEWSLITYRTKRSGRRPPWANSTAMRTARWTRTARKRFGLAKLTR
ncbi:hypothetical protein NL676_034969 [Syzygium grande]|nr:hypothetical protein NL676_034969 [Syzygium grande]